MGRTGWGQTATVWGRGAARTEDRSRRGAWGAPEGLLTQEWSGLQCTGKGQEGLWLLGEGHLTQAPPWVSHTYAYLRTTCTALTPGCSSLWMQSDQKGDMGQ